MRSMLRTQSWHLGTTDFVNFNSCLSADHEQVFVGTCCALVPGGSSAASRKQRPALLLLANLRFG